LDYQSNSRKVREGFPTEGPDKKIEKVVTGEVIQKPKSIGRKFKDIFFGGDIKLATRFVTGEVLLPALRNLVVEMTSKGIERVVYGESSFRRQYYDPRPRIMYNNPLYRPDPRQPNIPIPSRRLPDQNYRTRREAQDIIVQSREEAEDVVEQLMDVLDKYQVVSLADLMATVGLEHQSSHIDNKWGWTYLNNVEIRQVRDGFLIDLPPLEEI
jgi:hypothetical protein